MKKAKLTEKAQKAKKSKTIDSNATEKKSVKPSKINDGKCCRCIYRTDVQCTNAKSDKYGKPVPRKSTCDCFKYND